METKAQLNCGTVLYNYVFHFAKFYGFRIFSPYLLLLTNSELIIIINKRYVRRALSRESAFNSSRHEFEFLRGTYYL